MKMRTGFFCVALLAIMSILAVGCGNGPSEEEGDEGTSEVQPIEATIGVSLLTRTHPFYQELEAAMVAEGNKHNFVLEVFSGEFDVAKQKDHIEDFIVKKVNAIILCPCDSRSIGTSVAKANEAGIPVFTADIQCLAEGVKIVSHIATDNLAGGREAAKALIEALGGAGKVAVIDHPEVESVILRVQGFKEVVSEAKDIEIVAVLPGGGVKDKAFKATEDLLQAHPDLNGIFGINDDSALGALAAIEKAGKQGKIVIVGFDAVPEARAAIKAGKIHADVVQKPTVIGQKTVDAIARYMAGEEVEPEILIPCELFTKDSEE